MSNPQKPHIQQPQVWQQTPSAQQPQPYAQAPQYQTMQSATQPAAPPHQVSLPQQQSYTVSVTPPTNTLSVMSLISSILGWFLFGIFCVIGVIMGHISLSQIKRRGEGGKGMAIASLIIGYLGIVGWLIVVALFLIFIGLLGATAAASGSVYTA